MMEDRIKIKKRLEVLLQRFEVGRQRHEALSQEREQLGAELNAITGGIQTCREILGEEVIVPQTPPTRQQRNAATRAAKKKTPAKK